MSADAPSLVYDRQGHTVVLTMNRPARRNALSLDMIVRLADAWEAIDADETIRSAILTGAEGAYCVGGDLDAGWMTGNRSTEPSENERRAMEDMSIVGRGLLLTTWLRTPIIAVVNGDCMGGGCEMLQQTDIRIAEEQARFGVPEARRGLIAGAGSTMRLKRQIPYAVALEMLITGRILDAEEALRWGLVTHVVPTGEGLGKGHEIAGDHRRQRAAVGGRVEGVGGRDRLAPRGRRAPDRGRLLEHGHAQQRRQGRHEGVRREAPAELHRHLTGPRSPGLLCASGWVEQGVCVAEMPSGTVTFLFTDLEGSTRPVGAVPRSDAGGPGPSRRAPPGCGRGPRWSRGEDDGRRCARGVRGRVRRAAGGRRGRSRRGSRSSPGTRPAPLRVRMGVHTGEAERATVTTTVPH